MKLQENCYQTVFKNRELGKIINDLEKASKDKLKIIIRTLRTKVYNCSCAVSDNCYLHIKKEYKEEIYEKITYSTITLPIILTMFLSIIINLFSIFLCKVLSDIKY